MELIFASHCEMIGIIMNIYNKLSTQPAFVGTLCSACSVIMTGTRSAFLKDTLGICQTLRLHINSSWLCRCIFRDFQGSSWMIHISVSKAVHAWICREKLRAPFCWVHDELCTSNTFPSASLINTILSKASKTSGRVGQLLFPFIKKEECQTLIPNRQKCLLNHSSPHISLYC